jgi:molybdate transport system ATP-binding protein
VVDSAKEKLRMRLLLQNVDLSLAAFNLELATEIRGPITVIFGPSGSGKTSLLDFIAGLRRANSAFVQLDNEVLTDTARQIHVPARRRGIGYVPQDLALFPHLSVRRNLLYGHRDGDSRFQFDQITELLGIRPLIDRGVTELSGGEKQRVALARALLCSPRLLLFDEPLANLDLQLKTKILPYLALIRDEFHIPILYVTHDRFEALSLASEVIVLMGGRIVQSGPAQEVFSRPANLQVADLLTVETIEPGEIIQSADDLFTVAVGQTQVHATGANLPPGIAKVFVCIHAEDVVLLKGREMAGSARNRLVGTVRSLTREGKLIRVDIDCGFLLAAFVTNQACEELGLKITDQVTALIKAPAVHLIPRN